MPGDPEIRALAEAIFADLLADQVLTTTIAAHREVKRGQAVCATCGTRCRAHVPIAPLASGSTSAVGSRESSPARGITVRPNGYTIGPEKGTGGGTGIGSGSGRVDAAGNAFFDCLVCGRSVTSNRYAPHLASCLGFSGSTRRGASRVAAAKARLGADGRASPSPYLTGDDSDTESLSGKRKKLLNGNGKRASSPSKATLKKARLAQGHSGSAPPASRPPHPPSRLGRPPTSAKSASPYASPEKSGAASVPVWREGSAASSTSGGKSGKKSVPPPPAPQNVADGEESSEADDDY
ncbi:hypothetical protein CC85DRAFT_256903 [Cutaneotrichosporon oleaginosum]|uniref:SAGA-associated factor 11 n=1 Tax=Cutaneotrichosporon oleaginosum TaxID=879819 RepID=A0A0J0XU54_9TREE|nr:uncharacterized protein CC85DRAFT_256903 [Cutaneotrichosporon oleaginosum]KLT44595.1 hypothetical protein CC85DRAFT_256903 [Cutaneotrichosporon oleaginosum]TXT13890.1 hypothetical protein COLE_00083 [Cutaneotrichosporon oleaginosum]